MGCEWQRQEQAASPKSTTIQANHVMLSVKCVVQAELCIRREKVGGKERISTILGETMKDFLENIMNKLRWTHDII